MNIYKILYGDTRFIANFFDIYGRIVSSIHIISGS